MNKLALLIVIITCSFISTFAQNEKKPEFFGGFSFKSIDTGIKSADLATTTTLDNRFQASGFHVAGTGYLTRRLGITGDFSGNYKSRNDQFGAATGRTKFSLYNLTGGPQFRLLNSSRFTPFVQGLAGIARRNLQETFTAVGTTFNDDTTNFALNLGGGVDYRINKRFSWRVAQFDYNPIFVRSRTVNTTLIPDRTLNGFRFSTGIVIK